VRRPYHDQFLHPFPNRLLLHRRNQQ
jgi:hypothetical protein